MKRMLIMTGGTKRNLNYARKAAYAIKENPVDVQCVIATRKSDPEIATITQQILCPDKPIFWSGRPWKNKAIMSFIRANCDIGISTGFDYIVSKDLLNVLPIINCHPSYLPFNRGCHHSFWGIMEKTVLGGTIHWMDAGLDTGPIIAQKQFFDNGTMTAGKIQEKSEAICVELIKENLEKILSGEAESIVQGIGTYHSREEINTASTIKSGESIEVDDLFDLCRATACNKNGFFIIKGYKKFWIRIYEVEEV